MTHKTHKILKWVARVLAVATLLFGLPFYFGYGNPLPFIKPDLTLWDNMWLSIFPFMFIGLLIGIFWEKIGGYLVTISVGLGLIIGVFFRGSFVTHMLVPVFIGILFLIVGYSNNQKNN